jgi:hypothetical protein
MNRGPIEPEYHGFMYKDEKIGGNNLNHFVKIYSSLILCRESQAA